MLKANNDWIEVKDYSNSKTYWKPEYIDLKPFKGKTIVVRFTVTGAPMSGAPSSKWAIQQVQVIPEVTPP